MQGVVKYACSEEVPEPVDLQGEGFSVAFDPLDGSSIVDTNFTVGTIFGIWPGNKLTGVTGRDQVRLQPPSLIQSGIMLCQDCRILEAPALQQRSRFH